MKTGEPTFDWIDMVDEQYTSPPTIISISGRYDSTKVVVESNSTIPIFICDETTDE